MSRFLPKVNQVYFLGLALLIAFGAGLFGSEFRHRLVPSGTRWAESPVAADNDWEKIDPVLRELGQRHVAYGVKEQHYNTLRSALVWAFGQALQPGFDDEVRAAWTAVNQQMKIGAAAVPFSQQKPTPVEKLR